MMMNESYAKIKLWFDRKCVVFLVENNEIEEFGFSECSTEFSLQNVQNLSRKMKTSSQFIYFVPYFRHGKNYWHDEKFSFSIFFVYEKAIERTQNIPTNILHIIHFQ